MTSVELCMSSQRRAQAVICHWLAVTVLLCYCVTVTGCYCVCSWCMKKLFFSGSSHLVQLVILHLLMLGSSLISL